MALRSDQVIQSLLGLLILILSGLFTWSLVRINTLTAQDADLKMKIALMQQTLEQIADNTDTDTKQDEQIRKFWRITGTHRDWINQLRTEHGLPLQSWPDLD